MEEKKNLLTYAGLKALEDELHDLKVNRRKEVAGKIKEAREQGDLSENAEYDAAKDEQRDIEARIEEIEKILKNAEVVVVCCLTYQFFLWELTFECFFNRNGRIRRTGHTHCLNLSRYRTVQRCFVRNS